MDWIGNDRILLRTSVTEDLWGFNIPRTEIYNAHIVPATFDGELITVFDKESGLFDGVFGNFGTRKVGGQWKAYFGAWERERDQVQGFPWRGIYLYEVDVQTGSSRRIALKGNREDHRNWLIAPNGTIAATFDLDRNSGKWSITNDSADRIAEGKQADGAAAILGLGYSGNTVIYSERGEDGYSRWFEVPLSGGEPQPFLDDVDVDRLYFDESSGRLIGHRDLGGRAHFADPAHQKAVDMAARAFARYHVTLVDWSADFTKILIRTSGNGDSGTWYIFEPESKRASAIAFERRQIKADKVGPVSTFAYKASDGLDLDGILTLPPHKEPVDLPVILLPHGGPHAHDREQFDWWAQAFASRGYAVFQPNFRGSTNRDEAFMLAGYGEWGGKMQTDISDGLAALAAKGIVDPERACITGASYGGYAALAGVTVQNGLYRCAVAVAPVSDLHALFEEGYEERSYRSRITKAALLDRFGPKDRWAEVSPRRLASRADAPIMLIHGRDDTVVRYSHSTEMADRLKDHGKPFEFVELEDEDHWLSLSSTRLQMLEAAVGFVEKHNPAD
ncbi:prolyl oligopeptidase family serine peptidase [Qipengyuania sp. 1NDH10]|nr:prolyl oligopeptidase family serine peptidase [Qipengyuania vesicularis]